MNIFITTQMRTGSTWLLDVLAELLGTRWIFWEKGRDIPASRFKKQIDGDSTNRFNLFKIHYTPPERICGCIPKGDKNNFVISITRDLRDIAISKIFYMRYNKPMRGIGRLKKLEEERQNFGNKRLSDKHYVNSFIESPHFNNMIKNWQMYNDGFKHDNYLLVTYEEFSRRKALIIKKICDLLGVRKTTKQIRTVLVRNSFENKTGRKAGIGSNKSFRRKGIVGDHNNWLSKENLDRLTKIVEERGYVIPPIEKSTEKLIKVKVENKSINHLFKPLLRKKIIVYDNIRKKYIINKKVFNRI